MKALILRGKHKGKELEISQWCNDWFTTNTGDPAIDCKPFSPSSLSFTKKDMDMIEKHKNNGMLFRWFHKALLPDGRWGFKKYPPFLRK